MTKTQEVRISRRTGHDRLSVKVAYPTGGFIELRITRNGDKLVMGASCDPTVAAHQGDVIDAWLKPLPDETNAARLRRLEDMAIRYKSVAQLVQSLEGTRV